MLVNDMNSSEENDSNNPSSDEEQDESERTAIRSQLSTLSFEELQKLKEKVGAKVYKEALFGKKQQSKMSAKIIFKRENKNRPREMSAKKPVPLITAVPKVKQKEIRDPRFDPLCGEFDKKQFDNNYGFLSEKRVQDMKAIRAELKETADPERQIKLRRLLQRLNDQHRDSKRGKKEHELKEMKKEQAKQEFMEGRKPQFKNKSEMRVEALVKQYEELKKDGASRIQRHLKRRQQKVKKRSHRAPTGGS